MIGWTDGQMGGWVDGWMDGRMDDGLAHLPNFILEPEVLT